MATETMLHSNAFNFLSYYKGGVDPRTGLYTVAIDLPELKCNDLTGPVVPLGLAYSPMSTGDSGFGPGWSLRLTQYSPGNQILSLHTGETFKVSSRDGAPWIPEQKLKSFIFHELGAGQYRVVHRTGLVEILEVQQTGKPALPVEIRDAAGRRARLGYEDGPEGPELAWVADDNGRLLEIDRQRNNYRVNIHLHPTRGAGGQPVATFVMHLRSGNESRLELPVAEKASWQFSYRRIHEVECIVSVVTPLGAVETVKYGDLGHAFPGTGGRAPLPRVTEHQLEPGAGQPGTISRYEYGSDGHNFLGFGAPGLNWSDDGLDNLYRVIADYSYETTEKTFASDLDVPGAELKRVRRRFNRFHLLFEESTFRPSREAAYSTAVKETLTEYHLNTDRPEFEYQPAQCQLPKAVTTQWSTLTSDYRAGAADTLGRDGQRAFFSWTEESDYDTDGNLTRKLRTDGVTEVQAWYPWQGDGDDCPADPWEFVSQLREKRVIPAPASAPGDPVEDAQELVTRYRYKALPSIEPLGYDWIVPCEERLDDAQGALIKTSAFEYFVERETPGQGDWRVAFGRKRREAISYPDPAGEAAYTLTTDFTYEKIDASYTLRTLEAFSSSVDAVTKVLKREHSLLNGEFLLDRDESTDVETRYTYDTLGRVTSETVAPDSPEFAASRLYSYGLTVAGSMPWQRSVNVKGVETMTHLDGLNRVVSEQRQVVDPEFGDSPNAFRNIYSATYDALGQKVSESEIDWLADRDCVLRTTFEYDGWGEQCSQLGPDQVREHERKDPVARTVRRWREGEGLTVEQLNLFDKPVIERRYLHAEDSAPYSTRLYNYDGLGRTWTETDPLGNKTCHRYDAFDRPHTKVLPGGDRVVRTYAPYSEEEDQVRITVNDIELGTQQFDGLGRLRQSTVGGRTRTLEYTAGQMQPSKVLTPKGETIRYTYEPRLGEDPLTRATTGQDATYTYDPKDARLMRVSERDEQLVRTYFSNGELKKESREVPQGTFEMNFCYSLAGRLLSLTDVSQVTQHHSYDVAGRVIATEYRNGAAPAVLSSTFEYDSMGHLSQIASTAEDGTSLTTRISYDEFGREAAREFLFGDGTGQTLLQTYDPLDRLDNRRLLDNAGNVLRDERFIYDPRGRLLLYQATGPQRPVDPMGNLIDQQLFLSDALDNLTSVTTYFPGGSNVATYTYSDVDPVQLKVIENTPGQNARHTRPGDRVTEQRVAGTAPEPQAYAERVELEYDADGNMISDENSRVLTYDPLGRLISVELTPGGETIGYQYDAQDLLVGSDDGERRFYHQDAIVGLRAAGQNRTFLRGAGQLLAEIVTE